MQVKPRVPRTLTSGVMTFRLSEVMVLPQKAKEPFLKFVIDHETKPIDIERVFPLLTAPSQIMAS